MKSSRDFSKEIFKIGEKIFHLNNSLKISWKRLLIPEFPIAGVSITDNWLKVILFDKTPLKIKHLFSFQLRPHIIEEGVLSKPEELKILVRGIKRKIWPKTKKGHIILSLPSSNFYLQSFILPEMQEKMLEEAIIFNVQTNAPLPLEEAYLDWELLKEEKKDEIEIFAVLGIKKNIDAYLKVFQGEGLEVVALEPYTLSYGRALSFLNDDFKKKNILAIDFRLDGIEFMLFEKGRLIYFDYDSWKEIFPLGVPDKIEISHIKDHFQKELPALLNYFVLKRNQKIDLFSLSSFNPYFSKPLINFIKKEYNLEEFRFNINKYFKKPFNESFLGVIGVSLRSLIPRSYDNIVSLMPIGTEERYLTEYTQRISSLWSKIFLIFFLFFTFLLIFIDKVYLTQVKGNLKKSLTLSSNAIIIQKERELSKKAEDFNKLVKDINKILEYRLNTDEILNLFLEKSKEFNIGIRKIMISGYPSKNFTFQGKISEKEKIYDFLNSLKNLGKFENLSLPLSNITETQEGIFFYLTGNFK